MKSKQLKSRCTCCHVCRTSLRNYPRDHLDCTECNAVVCRQCFENRLDNITWEEGLAKKDDWICPACDGSCACARCASRPLEIRESRPTIKRKLSRDFIDDDDDSDIFRVTKAKLSRKREELVMSEKHCEKFICNIENLLRAMKKEKKDIQSKLLSLEKLGGGWDRNSDWTHNGVVWEDADTRLTGTLRTLLSTMT